MPGEAGRSILTPLLGAEFAKGVAPGTDSEEFRDDL